MFYVAHVRRIIMGMVDNAAWRYMEQSQQTTRDSKRLCENFGLLRQAFIA